MRVLTLAEVQQMEPGETIPAFRAQIKEVKDFYRGTQKQSGDPFTTQKLLVMDGTALMTVKIWDHSEFTKQWQQVWVVFESGQSKKDGSLIGMRIKDDEYRGRTTRLVEVKESATITQAQPGATQTAPQQMPPPTQAPAQMPPPTQTAPQTMPPPVQQQPTGTPESDYEPRPAPKTNGQTPQETRQAIQDARERLGKAANGLILCYDAAFYVALEVMKKHPDAVFKPEELEKIAVHLSIALERSGVVHGLPAGPLAGWLKKPDEQKGEA